MRNPQTFHNDTFSLRQSSGTKGCTTVQQAHGHVMENSASWCWEYPKLEYKSSGEDKGSTKNTTCRYNAHSLGGVRALHSPPARPASSLQQAGHSTTKMGSDAVRQDMRCTTRKERQSLKIEVTDGQTREAYPINWLARDQYSR